jgi:predicted ArsR family transcriptional regulator
MDLRVAEDEPIRPVDQLVLDLLRRENGLSIQDLMDRLEVTATAIRQRIDRLELAGFVEKRKHSAGRGRPSFNYFLTDKGWRQAGVTYSELAKSLWSVINSIPDAGQRANLIQLAGKTMGDAMGARIPEAALEHRMHQLAELLGEQKIPTSVIQTIQTPILEVHVCPYPDLVGQDMDRTVCQLEEHALSQALGHPLHLSKCRLDGHGCCQFSLAEPSGVEPSLLSILEPTNQVP